MGVFEELSLEWMFRNPLSELVWVKFDFDFSPNGPSSRFDYKLSVKRLLRCPEYVFPNLITKKQCCRQKEKKRDFVFMVGFSYVISKVTR